MPLRPSKTSKLTPIWVRLRHAKPIAALRRGYYWFNQLLKRVTEREQYGRATEREQYGKIRRKPVNGLFKKNKGKGWDRMIDDQMEMQQERPGFRPS